MYAKQKPGAITQLLVFFNPLMLVVTYILKQTWKSLLKVCVGMTFSYHQALKC